MDQSPNPIAGGMTENDAELVPKRENGVDHHQSGSVNGEPTVKIKVSHADEQFDFVVPSLSTFGDLKRLLAIEKGLDEATLKLLFRGQEKEDNEQLQNAGVKDNAKLLMIPMVEPVGEMNHEVQTNIEPTNTKIDEITQQMADLKPPSSEDEKPEEPQKPELSRACIAITEVRSEVDKLEEQVGALEEVVNGGSEVEGQQFVALTEFLMRQLLKLDCIEAEGEEKVQRKSEVRRIQNLEDRLDSLKERNCNLSISSISNTIPPNWDSGTSGSLIPPS